MNLVKATYDYWTDFWQRAALFNQILFDRGDNYLKHRQTKAPVLGFDYKLIMDGRSCEKPTCYDLLKILPGPGIEHHPNRRPIIIIDPRAGHGPGIGGFKLESEVGMALSMGHPVYFIVFHPNPIEGQTLGDVRDAEVLFIQEVIRRHEGLPRPAVIGNCQAGWASAFLGSSHPDLMSTIIMAGAPLSYWAGQKGKNPMRYRGGLLGGSWVVSYLADLGQGIFDGAHLVDGFERLNPANTLWNKLYKVFSRVDSERDRFLGFEIWWGGFFFTTMEEIQQIVQDLFVGNKLEKGEVVLREGEAPIDLKNIKANVVVFASEGDNITPPAQALQWIPAIYRDATEIKEMGRRIIYCIHPNIGHLGIFVAATVANREHKAIIGGLREIDKLEPGFYELVIADDGTFSYELREFSNLEKYGVSFSDYPVFERMNAVSERNQAFYDKFVRPWVRGFSNPLTSLLIKFSHPLRVQRYVFSKLNPIAPLVREVAKWSDDNRKIVGDENPIKRLEKLGAAFIEESLRYGGNMRDNSQEAAFWGIYG